MAPDLETLAKEPARKIDETVPLALSMFVVPFAIESLMIMLGAITTDGGGMYKICLATLISHWVGIAIIVTRRHRRLTKEDVSFIKGGFVLIYILVFVFLGLWLVAVARFNLYRLF